MKNTTPVKKTEKIVKLARSRGAPEIDLIDPTEYQRFLSAVSYTREGGGPKMDTDTKTQLEYIDISRDTPLKSNYVFIISSEMSALKAQQLALDIFLNAIDYYNHKEAPQKDQPLWHTVFGGYSDRLRDNPQGISRNPSLLVIDGLAVNSTDAKIEKARDLLMKYSDIPRVLVTCGMCPLKFAYERLYFPVNRVVLFGAKKHTTI